MASVLNCSLHFYNPTLNLFIFIFCNFPLFYRHYCWLHARANNFWHSNVLRFYNHPHTHHRVVCKETPSRMVFLPVQFSFCSLHIYIYFAVPYIAGIASQMTHLCTRIKYFRSSNRRILKLNVHIRLFVVFKKIIKNVVESAPTHWTVTFLIIIIIMTCKLALRLQKFRLSWWEEDSFCTRY